VIKARRAVCNLPSKAIQTFQVHRLASVTYRLRRTSVRADDQTGQRFVQLRLLPSLPWSQSFPVSRIGPIFPLAVLAWRTSDGGYDPVAQTLLFGAKLVDSVSFHSHDTVCEMSATAQLTMQLELDEDLAQILDTIEDRIPSASLGAA
jgi:hypothetical protein